MLLPSIRRLALADVDEDVLRGLIEHGEDLLVERKRQPPAPPRFGAGVAAFANTIGGFILLGVNDDKTLHGWQPPEGRDLQSHIAELLRQEVDPLPPFVVEMRELDGKPIGVIRVFESVDGPHIVRGTGALYLRSSKGKEPVPVQDQRTLIELARRGREAEDEARVRLAAQPVIGEVFWVPDWSGFNMRQTRDDSEVRFVARAAPLTVTPPLRDWPLTRRAADRAHELVDRLVPRLPVSNRDPTRAPHGRAMVTSVERATVTGARQAATIVMDSAGVFGVEQRFGNDREGRTAPLTMETVGAVIVPLARTLATLLQESEAYGRAVTDLWLMLPPRSLPEGVAFGVHASSEITIPADEDEIMDMSAGWHRELQRNFGIVKYEREA